MAEDKTIKGPDVNEMFQKMGEKLGWFKHKNLNEAKQSVRFSASLIFSNFTVRSKSLKLLNP